MLRRFLNLFRSKKLAEDIEEELAFHRCQTSGRFGNVTRIQEQSHEASTIVWIETVLQDLRIAFRGLRCAPTFTAIALLSIALSVAATAVVFTAVKSVLLDPLPYARSAELVQLRSDHDLAGPSHSDWLSWNNAQEIIRRTRTLASVGIHGNAVFDLGGGHSTPPDALYGLRVSASLFPTLGVSPMLGRNIRPGEDQPHRPNEIILSYGLWQRHFHSDPHVVGQNVQVNGHDCLVIGVMSRDFNFPLSRGAVRTPFAYVEFWAPLQIDPTNPADLGGGLQAVARLRPGVSLAEAQQDLASINKALVREFPAANRDRTLRLAPLWDRTVGTARHSLWLLFGAASLFLLIGCANVANLLLARGFARRREISLRMAIGAARVRIVRQFLTESSLLAALGGVAGYALTAAAWKILPAIAPVSIPRLASGTANWTVFAFALTLSLLSGLLFGIAPAFRAAESNDFASRGTASAEQHRLRSSLVIVEVTLAVTLVLLGGQLLSSFIGLLENDPGFQAKRVLASVVLPAHERYTTPIQRAAIYQRFLHAVRALPGVETAGTVDALPFSGENHGGFITATSLKSQLVAEVDIIGGDYLPALGARLIAGRWFRQEETTAANNSALINDVVAHHFWPATTALGKFICVNCTLEHPQNWKRVIGVVSTVRHMALEGPLPPNVYLSASAFEEASFVVIRTDRPTGEMENAVRRAIASVDPNQPVLLSATLHSLLSDSVADRRFIVDLLTATACLALIMSLAGIYGVTSYTTSRRTQEIGIRMALGATPRSVQTLVFRRQFQSVLTGLAAGLALTLAVQRVLGGMIAGLTNTQTSGFWIAALLVSLTALAACWLPTRRATRIDPMRALRQD